jgi:polyhydroxyalkanoate synthesis repressor PhaR
MLHLLRNIRAANRPADGLSKQAIIRERAMATQAAKDGDTIIIKKYANRRLYNTRSSSYITLDHLSKMTRENVEYKVIDAKTGSDITHQILTQIIMEEEAGGEQMLPVSFLRQLISMYGNSMQSLIPHYLEASMDNFRNNQTKLAKAFETSLGNNPLARLAEQNMAMFKVAASAFMPGADRSGGDTSAFGSGAAGSTAGAAPTKDADATQAESGTRDDIAALRAQMAEMQRRLDSIGS